MAYGVVIGVALLVVVTATALLLAGKAAQGVAQFREENHVSFLGRERE